MCFKSYITVKEIPQKIPIEVYKELNELGNKINLSHVVDYDIVLTRSETGRWISDLINDYEGIKRKVHENNESIIELSKVISLKQENPIFEKNQKLKIERLLMKVPFIIYEEFKILKDISNLSIIKGYDSVMSQSETGRFVHHIIIKIDEFQKKYIKQHDLINKLVKEINTLDK